MDTGIGLSLTGSALTLLIVGGGAVGAFVLVFIILACGMTNEVVIARRFILVARLAMLGLLACYSFQLWLDMRPVMKQVPVSLPQLRVVRPIVGLVLLIPGFFVSSHQIFRWITVLAQPFFIISCALTAAQWTVVQGCRLTGACLQQSGYTNAQIDWLVGVQYGSIACQLWVLLAAGYLLIAMGACHSRYPVRLFSVTKPLASVPTASPAARSAATAARTAAFGNRPAGAGGGNAGRTATQSGRTNTSAGGGSGSGNSGRTATSAGRSTGNRAGSGAAPRPILRSTSARLPASAGSPSSPSPQSRSPDGVRSASGAPGFAQNRASRRGIGGPA